MNNSESKKRKHNQVITLIILTIVLFGIIGVLIWDTVKKIKHGWSDKNTFDLIFSIFIVLAGSAVCYPIEQFFIYRDKRILQLNNDIYRLFNRIKAIDKEIEIKKLYLEKQKTQSIQKINKILGKKKIVTINNSNVSGLFYKTHPIYNGEINLGICKTFRIEKAYTKYLSNESDEYERLYQEIESRSILRKKSFPIIELILPFLFGALGFIISIYQALNVNGDIHESIIEYLKLFFASIFFVGSLNLYSIDPSRAKIIKEKKKLYNDLKTILNKYS